MKRLPFTPQSQGFTEIFIRRAVATTLVMAAMEVRTRNGSVTLLNPQPAVARILDVLRAGEMFCIRRRAARDPAGHQRGR